MHQSKAIPMKYRYFLKLSYDGTNYHGWQVQPNGNSVQAEVDRALSVCLQDHVSVVAAGRTDTGVHAAEMYAHFDVDVELTTKLIEELLYKINNLLPVDIAVCSVLSVSQDSHARFDAISRTYNYRILTKKNPFKERYCYYWQGKIDMEKMNTAAQFLLGKHDFQCFSKVNTDVNNFFCEVIEAKWWCVDDELIFTITANRFLRNMVRAVVGTLFDIGRGKYEPKKIKEIMAGKKRALAGASMPAKGLILQKISYPENIFF